MTLAEASILIVDDEPILRLTFSLLLKKAGVTVHVANDGVQALEVLAREQVDAMLTDRQMPNMDGMTLLRTLHARGTVYPSVLFVTGVEAVSTCERDELGIVATVSKPLHPKDLLGTLERVLLPIPKL